MSAAVIPRAGFGSSDPTRRMVGWGVVVAVHAIVLWALVTGTARKGLEIIKKPLEAAVIQEVIIPPPPPPPPKEIKQPEIKQPKVEAPPPPFVPPPEVTPPTTSAPTIASVQAPPPTPAVIAPPPPPAPAPVGRADIKVACPTQVRPEMPSRAAKEGIEGVVRAQVLIRDGAVVKVDILSGPQVFREPVREAMLRYRCVTTGGDVVATQEFAFKFE
ncbi:energy transducer TonB [Ramlibacter sp. WS9]|uniref:energy transducer TonB n=1 Tax=Ramlibacter sp. WS9 TaxID=1882741 RepID=UPI0011414CBB|nr:energy transducer TonB [Ramlibacter sp. WS9]ROZ62747.1 energy transducer TonB [Ramlibacter sp. WS9]